MAIKVKHEGSTASRLAAAAQGGAAKRAMEAAALAKPSQIQTLAPAHASAPGVSTPHAQLISAPGGGAHAQLIGGGGGIGARFGGSGRGPSGGQSAGAISSRRGSGSGGDGSGDYKVTGTSIFNRPDDDSVWREDLRQWIRPWLPGEKEAEALRRTGEVQNDLVAERELTAQGRRERAALVEDVVNSIKAGKFSREELPALMEQFSGAEDTIKMADALREREPTAQERFDKGIVMDERGNRFYQKANGDYVPLPDPAAEAQEAEAQRQESERQKLEAEQAKAAQKREADRQKYIDKAIDRAHSDKYADDPPTIDDLKKIQEQAGMEYDELHPIQPAMSPTPSGEVQPVTEPTARKKKWGGFAD